MPPAKQIVVDENIPFAAEAFGSFGVVRVLAAGAITPAAVRAADGLCVRSVTRVDAALLAGSRVRFVGTATIGTDHIDLDYLAANKIAFAAAPGSNATSVSEWFTAAMLGVIVERGLRCDELTVGIIGVGNVGGRVAKKAAALGMRVLRCDPPRARVEGADNFVSRDELLRASDLVTVHVPLVRTGEDCTVNLADATFFSTLREGCIFLNSSRGDVVDEVALRAAVKTRGLISVLDVWQNEPAISTETFARVKIATPHIAGYAYDGKVRGTEMIYKAVCAALGESPAWVAAPFLPPPEVAAIVVKNVSRPRAEILHEIVAQVYPIAEDHARLAGTMSLPNAERGAAFTRLRKEYPRRREFSHTQVTLAEANAALQQAICGLGFRVS